MNKLKYKWKDEFNFKMLGKNKMRTIKIILLKQDFLEIVYGDSTQISLRRRKKVSYWRQIIFKIGSINSLMSRLKDSLNLAALSFLEIQETILMLYKKIGAIKLL